MRTCEKCGRELNIHKKVCRHCGHLNYEGYVQPEFKDLYPNVTSKDINRVVKTTLVMGILPGLLWPAAPTIMKNMEKQYDEARSEEK